MSTQTQIAFKEWAVVVDALGRGEQIIILRKGGIHEQRGEFRVEHRAFWLYPTQFHEAESSVIPSKRPAVREIAAAARPDQLVIEWFAEVAAVHELADLDSVRRLQGRHIWSEQVLQQRFEFGRAPGLHALVVRVSRAAAPLQIPISPAYGGCKSWIELASTPAQSGLTPVMSDAEFTEQSAEIAELLSAHAYTDA
jgi:hypothetical protein